MKNLTHVHEESRERRERILRWIFVVATVAGGLASMWPSLRGP